MRDYKHTIYNPPLTARELILRGLAGMGLFGALLFIGFLPTIGACIYG